jgi:hypothetical protein
VSGTPARRRSPFTRFVTTKREAFYWLAVLFTFALGTAGGDLLAEKLALGYWKSALVFGGAIALVFLTHVKLRLNAILAFWIAYILTRPLGPSIGDYLSQARGDGGLALGTTVTSAIFLLTILAVVVFLTITRRDRIESTVMTPAEAKSTPDARVLIVANKTAATPALVEAVRARAMAEPARFSLLVPNPDHLVFDRVSGDVRHGEQVLALALPLLAEAAGGEVGGRVASSPNTYDDIVEELNSGPYDEIILSTLPAHVSHWLHLDLPRRIANLGYSVTAASERVAVTA